MTNLEMLGYIAALISLMGVVLNAKKNIWCWAIWLVSNGFWIVYSAIEGDIPSVILWSMFSLFNVYGWIQWKKEK